MDANRKKTGLPTGGQRRRNQEAFPGAPSIARLDQAGFGTICWNCRSVVRGLWSSEIGVCNVCYALKTRYTRYTVDGQRFKVLHFCYIGCYTLLH